MYIRRCVCVCSCLCREREVHVSRQKSPCVAEASIGSYLTFPVSSQMDICRSIISISSYIYTYLRVHTYIVSIRISRYLECIYTCLDVSSHIQIHRHCGASGNPTWQRSGYRCSPSLSVVVSSFFSHFSEKTHLLSPFFLSFIRSSLYFILLFSRFLCICVYLLSLVFPRQ